MIVFIYLLDKSDVYRLLQVYSESKWLKQIYSPQLAVVFYV